MDTEYPTDKDLESFPAVFMTADNEWNPSIYDNYHDLLVQEASEISTETDTFQSRNSQDIAIFETSWEYNDFDLGNSYQYNDSNIHSCIRYAHLKAQDKASRRSMIDLYKPHKILPTIQILRNCA